MRRIWNWMWAEKRKWRGVAAVGLVVFLVGSVVSVEVTSQPAFCNSCHIMEPYYTSWKESSHRDISCVKCHIEPGTENFIKAKLNGLGQVVDDLLARTSFKPSASVNALSCTRSGCHTVETLSGKIISNGTYKFRHDKHLGRTHLGVELTCGTCHSHVTGDAHFEVTTSVCVTCHLVERDPYHTGITAGAGPFGEIRMVARTGSNPASDGPANGMLLDAGGVVRPPSGCTSCHDAPTELIESNGMTIDHSEYLSYGASCESCHRTATAIPPPIDDGRCVACHTFGVDRTLPVEEMHRVHAMGKHKVECFSCHGIVQHGLKAQTMTLEQFDCRRCHINEHSVQRDAYLLVSGEKGQGETIINPMFMAHVDCTGCHSTARPGSGSTMDHSQIMVATPESCDRCHKPGTGEQMIPLWQSSTKKLYERAVSRLESINRASLSEADRETLRRAEDLLEMVRLDGSWGVHNPQYTQELLERALGRIVEVLNGSGGGAG